MAIFDPLKGEELSEEERITHRREQLARSRKSGHRGKREKGNPENIARGIQTWNRMKGIEMEHDILVQGRVAAQDLATAVRVLGKQGDFASIKSYSALIQSSIAFLGKSLAQEEEDIIDDYDEALEILQRAGLLKPTTRRASSGAILRNRERLERNRNAVDRGEVEENESRVRGYTQDQLNEIAANQIEKFRKETENKLYEPKTYDYEEGELDNIIEAPERIKTEEEMRELEQFFDEMNKMKRRNLDPRRKKREEIDENNIITEKLAKQQQSLMRRGLLK